MTQIQIKQNLLIMDTKHNSINLPLQQLTEFSTNFFELIEGAKNMVITAHESPDDDSIASVLSVYEIISTKYPKKNIRIVFSSEPEDRFNIFKNYEKIEFVPDLAEEIIDTNLLIMLDGSQFSRFSKQPEKLKTIPKTICIDHHSSPADEFTLSLVAPFYPSCSEIIYLTLCGDFEVSKELAEIFMLGILGDTGNFTYLKPHQTETLTTAKKLLDISKIEIQEFQSQYRTISKRVFDVIQELMKNTNYKSVEGWPNFQYSFVERSFMDKDKYTDSEVSEANHSYMSHYLRMIEQYPWGFVVTPKLNGDCVISGRSLPKSVSVRDMMERIKLGGGHDRAAGGTFKKTDRDVGAVESINKVLNWIKNKRPVII